MSDTDWDAYIDAYHDGHAGITERALEHSRHPIYGSAYQWLAEALPSEAGDVVDLACGSCPMQPHLNYRTYLGIDRNEAELAAAVVVGRGPVQLGDVTALDLPDASADTVVISMALMLVPTAATLAEVFRVLRPGGNFAAMVPAMWPVALVDLPPAVALSAALRGPGSMPRTLTVRSLERELKQAGLALKTHTRQRFPFPLVTRDDARLAVSSLYTPGRTHAQIRRAESWLTRLARLPLRAELPVPLLRITAGKT